MTKIRKQHRTTVEGLLKQTGDCVSEVASHILDQMGKKEFLVYHMFGFGIVQDKEPTVRESGVGEQIPLGTLPRPLSHGLVRTVATHDRAWWLGARGAKRTPLLRPESYVHAKVGYIKNESMVDCVPVDLSITTAGGCTINDEHVAYAWDNEEKPPTNGESELLRQNACRALGASSVVLASAAAIAQFAPDTKLQADLGALYEVIGGTTVSRRNELWALPPERLLGADVLGLDGPM